MKMSKWKNENLNVLQLGCVSYTLAFRDSYDCHYIQVPFVYSCYS